MSFSLRFFHARRRLGFRPALFCLCAVSGVGAAGLLLEPRLSFASDLQAGGRAGIVGLPLGRGTGEVYLDVEGRLFPHTVRSRVSPTFSYQYRELRWSFGPGVSHVLPLGAGGVLNEWSLVLGSGLAWSAGDYRGTARKAQSGWLGWGEAGVRYTGGGEMFWGATAQFKPYPEVFPMRLLLQAGWLF